MTPVQVISLEVIRSTHLKTIDRSVIWIKHEAGQGTSLCRSIPAIGTMDHDADSFLDHLENKKRLSFLYRLLLITIISIISIIS